MNITKIVTRVKPAYEVTSIEQSPVLKGYLFLLNCPPFNIFNFWIRVIPSLDIYLLVIQIAYFFQLCKSTETRHNFFHNIEANLKIGKILIFCQYIKFANTIRTALRRKNKDWLARNQNNVPEWNDMSHCEPTSLCSLSAKNTALRRKSKDWLAQNQKTHDLPRSRRAC
jgi:hypothetical protein